MKKRYIHFLCPITSPPVGFHVQSCKYMRFMLELLCFIQICESRKFMKKALVFIITLILLANLTAVCQAEIIPISGKPIPLNRVKRHKRRIQKAYDEGGRHCEHRYQENGGERGGVRHFRGLCRKEQPERSDDSGTGAWTPGAALSGQETGCGRVCQHDDMRGSVPYRAL